MNFILIGLQNFEILIGNESKVGLIAILMLLAIFFLQRYLIKTIFVPNRKTKIFNEIVKLFNGKINYQGAPEFQFNNRNVTIDYEFESRTIGGYEYIIALIDISDIENMVKKKLNSEFEIVHHKNKFYVQFYSSWGYHGAKFKERLNEKMNKLNSQLSNNDCQNPT